MPVPYTKPPLPVVDQVALLQRRGMVVADVLAATSALERISYYRFTGYALRTRVAGADGAPIPAWSCRMMPLNCVQLCFTPIISSRGRQGHGQAVDNAPNWLFRPFCLGGQASLGVG